VLTPPLDRDAVLERVRAEIVAVRGRRGACTVVLDEATRLSELGIASLDLAEVVSNLEAAFELDPFAEAVAITSVTDVRSLCDAYWNCLSGAPRPPDDLDATLRAIRGKPRP
jgi:acyl carrier protein